MTIFENDMVDAAKFLQLINNRRKFILISGVLGFVIALLASLAIPVKYKASGTLYPGNVERWDELLKKPQFGTELDARHLLEIFDSDRLREAIFQKHDLIAYYALDTTIAGWPHQLHQSFRKDITYSRSVNRAIIITATMKDPELAAGVVNSMISLSDEVRDTIFRDNMEAELKSLELIYTAQEALTKKVLDSIYLLKPPSGADEILFNQVFTTDSSLVLVGESGYINSPQLERLANQYFLEKATLSKWKGRVDSAQTNFQRPLPKTYVLSSAKPAYDKSYDYLWRNAFAGGLAALFFAIIIIAFDDRFQIFRTQKAQA
ncbi:MAG: hypothetical protein AAF502_10640 [Bacteroidota bacterium]